MLTTEGRIRTPQEWRALLSPVVPDDVWPEDLLRAYEEAQHTLHQLGKELALILHQAVQKEESSHA